MPYIPQKGEFEKISRLMKGYGKPGELAEVMECTPETVRARLKKPGDFKLSELKSLSQRLHIPIEEIRQAITWEGSAK